MKKPEGLTEAEFKEALNIKKCLESKDQSERARYGYLTHKESIKKTIGYTPNPKAKIMLQWLLDNLSFDPGGFVLSK